MATIAIPAYQDYTIRAKVAEAILAMGPVRAAMQEANDIGSKGNLSQILVSGYPIKKDLAQYISKMEVGGVAVYVWVNIPEIPEKHRMFAYVPYQEDENGKKYFVYTSGKKIKGWTCYTRKARTKGPLVNYPLNQWIDAKYMPKSCHIGPDDNGTGPVAYITF